MVSSGTDSLGYNEVALTADACPVLRAGKWGPSFADFLRCQQEYPQTKPLPYSVHLDGLSQVQVLWGFVSLLLPEGFAARTIFAQSLLRVGSLVI